jgi:signal transduction histidine kinase
MAEAYKLNKEFENSSKYYEQVLKLKDSINDTRQNVAISEIKEKYDNEKLRADNLVIEANRVKNRNIAMALGGSLILGSIIAFLVYQNKQRQQKLILQDKEVKAQKLQAQLKEEELKSINAMVEGQEKERQRIANDLHDDLGSLMANIKMHFSSFKSKDSDHLYQRTNDLIEEAYQKIRNIAHAKNSGVLAKQGLYKSIKQHAKSISATKEIKIKVIENDLDERLENSLELTIFRVIQELITNTIKHAQASELDIHLNQHEDVLNIIVEDNGVGFDSSKPRNENSGMGLSSIERRIEQLGGTVIVESQPKNGTSVIIDIPL